MVLSSGVAICIHSFKESISAQAAMENVNVGHSEPSGLHCRDGGWFQSQGEEVY